MHLPLTASCVVALLALAGPALAQDEPLEVDVSGRQVNVMGRDLPPMPAFPPLEPIAGKVRGHAFDLAGKPLASVQLGVRSSAIGGASSGAQGTTDDKGYFEFDVPMGACEFYNAGLGLDWGDGRAAVGLHPADGDCEGFASANGVVENFVFVPYGVADLKNAQDQPQYPGNYYGGAIFVDFSVAEGRPWDLPTQLPEDAAIEVTLTPAAPLIDGTAGRPIVLKRKAADGGFYALNLPLTPKYTMTAKLADGTVLTLKEVGPYGSQPFGLTPKEAKGEATLVFRPTSAKADAALPSHGNWQSVDVMLGKPE